MKRSPTDSVWQSPASNDAGFDAPDRTKNADRAAAHRSQVPDGGGPTLQHLYPRSGVVARSHAQEVARPPPIEVVEGLLRQGVVSCIYGAPKSGKTFVLFHLVHAVSTGRPFFGLPTRQGRSVVISAETAYGPRGRAIVKRYGRSEQAFDIDIISDRFPLNDAEKMAALADDILADPRGRPAIVAFDSYSRCLKGVNQNCQKETAAVMDIVEAFAKRVGCAVVLVHHTSKNSLSPRGSGDFVAVLDMAMLVTRKRGKFEITVPIQRDARADLKFSFEIERMAFEDGTSSGVLVEADGAELAIGCPGPETKAQHLSVLRAYQVAEGRHTTQDEVAKVVGISKRSVQRARNELVADGYLKGNTVTPAGKERLEQFRAAAA